jgi:orotate phosphoribosyltransferase-like protein
MFALLELVADLNELRDMGLSDDEIAGYLDVFIENYGALFLEAEIV